MKKYLALILAAFLLVGACAGMDTTAQRTLTGGAVGAGSGAIIGAGAGSAASGALIGGGAGILGGYLYDQYMKSQGR
jgi:osmotically inducible lipoprotein OsmB